MTRDEIKTKLNEIFKDIFDDENIVIEETSNAKSIEGWDSLHHISIVDAIQKEFNVKFSFIELALFTNVGIIIETLVKKIK